MARSPLSQKVNLSHNSTKRLKRERSCLLVRFEKIIQQIFISFVIVYSSADIIAIFATEKGICWRIYIKEKGLLIQILTTNLVSNFQYSLDSNTMINLPSWDLLFSIFFRFVWIHCVF